MLELKSPGLNVQAAVNAPRIHHQWLPDEIRIQEGFSPDTIRLVEAMGHTVNEQTSMGAIQSIMVAEDGTMYGATDPRRSTSAAMGFQSPLTRDALHLKGGQSFDWSLMGNG